MSESDPKAVARQIEKARDLLLAGEVVAVPTETVYGLAASIYSEAGLKKIFSLKERPFFDPLIVHVASLKQAAAVTREWPPLADFLARTFWPGALTLVLPKSPEIHSLITSGLDTVAVRYPDHAVAVELIRLLGAPVAAPSANKFGHTSPSRREHVEKEFPQENLFILDGGDCEIGVESTVVKLTTDAVIILRPGGVTEEMLKEALTKWQHPVAVRRAAGNDPTSPGHLKHHYMPKIPLVIIEEFGGKSSLDFITLDRDRQLASKFTPSLSAAVVKALAELGASEPGSTKVSRKPAKHLVELKLADEPEIAARELYSEMRRLSESGAEALYVFHSRHHHSGLWSAIWDRLDRAASARVHEPPD